MGAMSDMKEEGGKNVLAARPPAKPNSRTPRLLPEWRYGSCPARCAARELDYNGVQRGTPVPGVPRGPCFTSGAGRKLCARGEYGGS